MRDYTFTVVLGPDLKGPGYRAFCPLLPGVSARGETRKEAVTRIRAALDRRLDLMIARGESIPSEGRRGRSATH